ncbi:aldo/keto reductase [Pseudodesulfovibrio thermohalotolerans]|uniref:aldo/keto reductase n=1 Tax=Pseudodesulfovibrio thermohalotolerans TaxID=2880651 RepID=UPI0024425059|nr:aldo/keto reductase [Pseudodesulfovibrio thermohalotolerans]WFS62799.1 aldo/keto reductase [Pseudodesulfovibrio thermohalotolerans]
MKYIMLHTGAKMPALGLGTWQAAKGEVARAVTEALRIGYRHVDCAHVYGNENEVGEALAATPVPRRELWITSKLWNNSQCPKDVRPALERSLEALGLDYLDLYLIHWPVQLSHTVMYPQSGSDLIAWTEEHALETWSALEDCVRAGLVRHIGTSNFSMKKIQVLLDKGSILPAVSQVEMHPYLQQNKMRAYCQANGMGITGFAPLGSKHRPAHQHKEGEPGLLNHPDILAMAERLGTTPASILLGWAVSRGTSVIPKSTNPERLRQNLAAADLELAEADMAIISAMDMSYRFLDGSHWMLKGSPYTLENIWDGE